MLGSQQIVSKYWSKGRRLVVFSCAYFCHNSPFCLRGSLSQINLVSQLQCQLENTNSQHLQWLILTTSAWTITEDIEDNRILVSVSHSLHVKDFKVLSFKSSLWTQSELHLQLSCQICAFQNPFLLYRSFTGSLQQQQKENWGYSVCNLPSEIVEHPAISYRGSFMKHIFSSEFRQLSFRPCFALHPQPHF